MAVQAKMYLESVTAHKWGTSVKFRVVTRGDENKAWANATPTGDMTLGIKNELALADFGLDALADEAEYLVTIERVPTPQAEG